jgi:hypothetical protein
MSLAGWPTRRPAASGGGSRSSPQPQDLGDDTLERLSRLAIASKSPGARARLLESIAKARLWLDGLIAGTFESTAEIALHERCSERSVRITLSLAFLAPAIVRAAVEGRLPYGLIASSFSELPMLWEEQLHLAS